MKTFTKVGIILIACLSLFCTVAKAQDTEFWFSAPEATVLHGDRPVMLYFTAVEADAVVTVEQPLLGYSTIIHVSNNQTESLDLTSRIDSVKCYPGITPGQYRAILDYGIHITSTTAITCYYEIVGYQLGAYSKGQLNSDLVSLKGKNALGTKFYIPSQNAFRTQRGSGGGEYATIKTSFDILATEDNTIVSITPRQDVVDYPTGVPHPAGKTFTVTLNRGQVYVCEAKNNKALDGQSSHLGGSKVESDKPVVITVADDSPKLENWNQSAPYNVAPYNQTKYNITSAGKDLLADQIIPVSKIGKEYILMKGKIIISSRDYPDFVFVIGTEDNTEVMVDGVSKTTINEGETYLYLLDSSSAHIKTSNPVYVWQVTGFGSEIGGAIIPSIICTGSTKLGFTRTNASEFILNIMVLSSSQALYLLNGAQINTIAAFTPIQNTDWSIAQIKFDTTKIPVGSTNIITSLGLTPFHLGIINGDPGLTCRYGYFSSFSAIQNTLSKDREISNYCEGETMELSTRDLSSDLLYYWVKDGDTLNKANPKQNVYIKTNMTLNDAGNYVLYVTKELFFCEKEIDTVHVVVNPIPVPILRDTTLCNGTFAILDPGNFSNAEFLWSTGETTRTIKVGTAGSYWVQVTQNDCTGYDTCEVYIIDAPNPKLDMQAAICKWNQDTITLKSSGNDGSFNFILKDSKTKQIVLDETIADKDTTTFTYLVPVASDNKYWAYFIHIPGGCMDSAEYTVKVYDPKVNLGEDRIICEGQSATLSAQAGSYDFLWNTGGTTQSIAVDMTGTYSVLVTETNSGCQVMDSVNVTVIPIPNVIASASRSVICQGDTVILRAAGAYTYKWTSATPESTLMGHTTDSIIILKPSATNTYYLAGYVGNSCNNSSHVIITVKPKPVAKIKAVPNPVSIKNPVITFTDVSLYGTMRLWDFGDGTTSTEKVYTHTYSKVDTATYLVILYAENDGGCKDSTSIYAVVRPEQTIFVPTAFIPDDNRSELNVFKAYGAHIIQFEMYVFDRWGKQVFYTTDMNQGWNGTFQGKPLPSGVYTYLIRYKDLDKEKMTKTGSVTLIR